MYDQTADTGADRPHQLFKAAERARRGRQTRRALALLAAAHSTAGDNAPLRARVELRRGLLLLSDGPVADAHQTLLLAAEALGSHDVEGAEQALSAAAEAAWAAGDLTAYLQTLERPADRTADETPPAGRPENPAAATAPSGVFRAGMRHVVVVDFARAARELEPLFAAAAHTQRPDDLLYAGRAALVLGDIAAARRLLGRALAAAGAQGVSEPTARILEFLATPNCAPASTSRPAPTPRKVSEPPAGSVSATSAHNTTRCWPWSSPWWAPTPPPNTTPRPPCRSPGRMGCSR